jgi:hypothetical protein
MMYEGFEFLIRLRLIGSEFTAECRSFVSLTPFWVRQGELGELGHLICPRMIM